MRIKINRMNGIIRPGEQSGVKTETTKIIHNSIQENKIISYIH